MSSVVDYDVDTVPLVLFMIVECKKSFLSQSATVPVLMWGSDTFYTPSLQ